MIFLALMDYHKLMRCSGVIYLACVAILSAIIVAGQFGGAGTGARRWITLPVIGRFQAPSGICLVVFLLLVSAAKSADQQSPHIDHRGFLRFPLLLIMKQPDPVPRDYRYRVRILCLILSQTHYSDHRRRSLCGSQGWHSRYFLLRGAVPVPDRISGKIESSPSSIPERFRRLQGISTVARVAIGSGILVCSTRRHFP